MGRARASARVVEKRVDFRTPNWSASGFDIYNVRDLHGVFGDLLVSSASASRFRLFEHHAIQPLVYRHYFPQGMRWAHAPPPRLAGTYRVEHRRERFAARAGRGPAPCAPLERPSETFHKLVEDEILFDAANVMRLGEDVLYLVSSTGTGWGARGCRPRSAIATAMQRHQRVPLSHLDSTSFPCVPASCC
jgi:glycine amidinotransferase/scyllo-inosamine-4-phosphate amidinotransferase 1